MRVGNSNRTAGLLFRSQVLNFLHAAGHTKATLTRPEGWPISQALREDPADVTGLPIAVTVRAQQAQSLTGPLNDAQRSAEMNDLDFAAAVVSRRGYPIQHQYAVLTLEDFARLLHLIPVKDVTE